MKKTFLFISVLLTLSICASTGVCQTHWIKTYGGSSSDYAYSIQQTVDGGYIVAGKTDSCGAGGYDIWVLKLESNGIIQWEKTYGGSSYERGLFIQQTSDGGYIVGGRTQSYGAGSNDYFVLKLDSNGIVEWEKTYGGSSSCAARSIQQTVDGGYIVAGFTDSYGAGGYDAWVLKLDSNGIIEWEKTYGGSSYDESIAVQQTVDGGYIVAGDTVSYGAGGPDAWVLKLDSNGIVEWEKTYGGSSEDIAYAIQQTGDGGYIVAGLTDSYGAGGYDDWVLKLDSNGIVEWEKTYGGSGSCIARSIQQTGDGGYIVAGLTRSYGAGGSDGWVLKLDSNGIVQWEKTYGGSSDDYAYSIQQTVDGGYIVAGLTESYGAGGYDAWVLKLGSSGDINDCYIGISSATVTSNGVTGVNSSATVITTSASVNNSSVTVTDTITETETVCEDYTLIELASFTATPGNGEVVLEWITAGEIDNAGFNLYRAEDDGEYLKINAALIPAEGTATEGVMYLFVDEDVKNRKTYYYKLEDIDLNGTSTMHGPVSALPRLIYGIIR